MTCRNWQRIATARRIGDEQLRRGWTASGKACDGFLVRDQRFSPEAGRLAWAWRRVRDGALILLTPAPEKRDCPLSAVDTCPRNTLF
jgi:hypothetical protein